jgi:Na+-transporting methylmalonyl-CoA/oxaloacetate decarboxylase gamma subunit
LDSSLGIALIITAIGMTLLFLSLVLFYGMLSLLTAVIKDKPTPPAQRVVERDDGDTKEDRSRREESVLRAAAVAIALARAEMEQVSKFSAGIATGEASTRQPASLWWSLHHQRQLTPHPNAWRRR